MAEIVAFPTDSAALSSEETIDETTEDNFLLDEGLELLADFRAIPDLQVRNSLRVLVKSMSRAGVGA